MAINRTIIEDSARREYDVRMEYSSDKPIANSKQDRYSRKEYSKRLAKLLYEKNLNDDFVVGMYSKWGYGKSSTLTMVKEYIGENALVITFNPWIFENQQAIVNGLLFQLAKKLDKVSAEKSKKQNVAQKTVKFVGAKLTRNGALSKSDTATKLITNYIGVVGAGLSIATGIPATSTGAAAAGGAVKRYLKSSSIEDIKKRIEKKIQTTGKRVIIMIDDLDRLDKDEIFQLLKIVKVIADFKGVTYLIAIDEDAVVKAINNRFSSSGKKEAGRSFLEKIIQVPLHLPVIPRTTLNEELLSGIDEIFKENDIDISDDDARDFRVMYDSEISPLIDSPRMVTRYLNSLKFTVPFISKEVNLADFLVIESLRLFYPVEYDNIRHEKQLLTGANHSFSFRDDDEDENFKARISELTNDIAPVLEMVKGLFPVVNKKFEKNASSLSLSELRVQKRVASPDYYDRYFSYGLTEKDFSDTELINLITSDSSKTITAGLRELLKVKDQALILDKVKMYWKATQHPDKLAKAIIDVVGSLEREGAGAFMDSPVEKSVDILTDIIRTSPNRLEAIQTLLGDDIEPEQLFYLIREVELNSKKEDREKFLEKEDLAKFDELIVEYIKKLANSKPLHSSTSRVGHILYQYWSDYGDRNEVNDYLKSKLTTADDALEYATLFLSKWSGSRGTHRGNFDRGTYQYIEKTIDVDYLYALIIAEHPELRGISDFPDMEHSEDGVSKAGNENTPEFKLGLAKQIVYLFEHPPKEEDPIEVEEI